MFLVTPSVIEEDTKYSLSTSKTQYQLREGIVVTVKEPTIDLVAEVERIGDEVPFMKQNLEVAKLITEGYDWQDLSGISSRVVGRLVQDFLLMSAGNATRL